MKFAGIASCGIIDDISTADNPHSRLVSLNQALVLDDLPDKVL